MLAERQVCLSCHTDLRDALQSAVSTHPLEAADGRCTGCHTPHDPAAAPLLREKRSDLCESCHQDHARFAHPMGPNVADPRRPGETVSCLSCHDPHASDQPMMLILEPDRALCVDCHDRLH